MKFSLKKKRKAELKDENYRKCLEKWIQKEKSANSAKKEVAFAAKRGKLHKVLKKMSKTLKTKSVQFSNKEVYF